MIDLHTHTLMSDGALVPVEMVRRAAVAGCRFVALTDHADDSVLESIIPPLAALCRGLNARWAIKAIPGIELTHNPPEDISFLAAKAKRLGALIVVVHGESIVEPVPPGTNRAAIEAGVDILAHPGLISDEDAALAASRGVRLEITARRGHCYTNGHVAAMARRHGATLVINTDAHEPGDLVSRDRAEAVAKGAGMSPEEIKAAFAAAEALARECIDKMKG